MTAVARWGLPDPDPTPIVRDGLSTTLVWRDRYVAAATDAAIQEPLNAEGFTFVLLPLEPGAEPPAALAAALRESACG